MNRLQQKSWIGNHIEKVKEEILKDKMNIPEGWGPNELMLYIAHCFDKNKLSDLTEARQIEYTEVIENQKGA